MDGAKATLAAGAVPVLHQLFQAGTLSTPTPTLPKPSTDPRHARHVQEKDGPVEQREAALRGLLSISLQPDGVSACVGEGVTPNLVEMMRSEVRGPTHRRTRQRAGR